MYVEDDFSQDFYIFKIEIYVDGHIRECMNFKLFNLIRGVVQL